MSPRATSAPTRAKRSNKKADAILAADIHLRETIPECRTDDFMPAMERKLARIRELQKENGDCPVLVAGDIFHKWKASPWLLRWAIERINNWICIPGQHDLPGHSLDEYPRSALAVLEAARCVSVLGPAPMRNFTERLTLMDRFGWIEGFPWGHPIDKASGKYPSQIALVHKLVYPGKPPFPGAEIKGSTAKALLNKMKGFDLVITGDNHETFVHAQGHGENLWIDPTDGPETAFTLKASFPGNDSKRYRVLVNPGSMMRTTASQVDHEPCVFLWYADTNTVERVVLPHEKGVISREHIEAVEDRNKRAEEFAARLGDGFEAGTTFRGNLQSVIDSADPAVDDGTEKLAWTSLEGEGK